MKAGFAKPLEIKRHLMKKLLLLCFLLSLTLHAPAQTMLRAWQPTELARWNLSMGKDQRVENGALLFETQPGDAMLVSPPFEAIATSPWQRVELEMESDVSGPAQLFWTGNKEGKFGGFAGEKTTPFSVEAGARTYRIAPYWQAEKQIVRLRIDFPEAQGGRYKIKALRIVEEAPPALLSLPARDVSTVTGTWSGRLQWPAAKGAFATLRLSSAAKGSGVIGFASDAVNGWHNMSFPLRAGMHTYNVDLGADTDWRGNIIALRVETGDKANAKIESIALGDGPQGPADLEVTFLGPRDPFARSGKPQQIEAIVRNHGGETATNVTGHLRLEGARLLSAALPKADIEFGLPATLSWTIQADKPGAVRANLALAGAPPYETDINFRAPLSLPKAAYVPVPKPAKTDYQVGAYYFPGWNTASRWAPLKPFPERKPLLGFYREGDPEVADWHIKWAVEHGISFFLYDWYWDRGSRQLEHGLDALFKARYQNLMKFALLYANHNSADSHSAADFERMTKFWIDNYFKKPNYLTIGGKPVIVMFSPHNPVRDMGAENVKASFEKMRAMCREAGFKGLYLIACNNESPAQLAQYKAIGYDAVTAYNWAGSGMTAAEYTAKRAPYSTGIEGYRRSWENLAGANQLRVIPPIFAGWDPRPWHGDKSSIVRYDRTPSLFKKHLQDAKQFIDVHERDYKQKMLFVEAWNELGEGSYIEPHREFGFDYLEAIREVFAPTSPRPQEIVPADLGLGPYDVAENEARTVWDFTRAKDTLGWGGNVANLRVEEGALRFTTRGTDPALNSPNLQARASSFPFITLRIKASRPINGQLFWATPTAPVSEANSVRFDIPGDGTFHDVKVRMADNPRWRGLITGLRFDPGWLDNVDCTIEWMRLEEK